MVTSGDAGGYYSEMRIEDGYYRGHRFVCGDEIVNGVVNRGSLDLMIDSII